MKVMNEPELFDYGIHNEASNIRAHVAPLAKCVFVFPTICAQRYVEENKSHLRSVSAYQPGVEGRTAMGYLVSPKEISNIRVIDLPGGCLEGFTEELSTSEKGDRAVAIVETMMKAGWFPFWFEGEFETDTDVQTKGTDITAEGRWRIEVKCDFKASWEPGSPNPKCSGNLFLQTAERNPMKRR